MSKTLQKVKAKLRECAGVRTDSDGYVRLPSENLIPGVDMGQFEEDLRAGAGHEMRMKFCAVHSSAALAVNTFAPFKNRPGDLVLLGESGFGKPVFEKELDTGLPGNPPSVDVFLQNEHGAFAIESKFLEYFTPKTAEFSASYTREALDWAEDCWWEVLEEAKTAGKRHLDVAQLVKHYFGISHLLHKGHATQVTLVYLFWEPENAVAIPECQAHREEIAQLASHVQGSRIQFRFLSYKELWREWSSHQQLAEHVTLLLRRYSVRIPQIMGPRFHRYIGIDYSGAKTPTSSLKGLRVYLADRESDPAEVSPPPSSRKYWTRRGIAEWLVAELRKNGTTLVGIDHGFSFPIKYFDTHNIPHDWNAFLKDFHEHWPTDKDDIRVESVRKGQCGNGAARMGDRRWRRLTEIRAGAAKSVFHFDVQGSVAKSTHSGIPWLCYIRNDLGPMVHFWPFDGWRIPAGKSVIAEVYPSLWSRSFPRSDRTPDQHDAYAVTAWLKRADKDGALTAYFDPSLSEDEKRVAEVEGWILGVG